MNHKRSRAALVVTTLVLLLVLALGSIAPGVAAQVVEPQTGMVEVCDGLHGLWADPMAGGSSNG
jgi:hypothetical protein